MTARRHHYVPRCYLKGFSVPRKAKRVVHVFDRTEGRSFETKTENVALERDFNRVDVEGLEPDAFEKAIASFEGDLARALDRIITSRSLKDPDARAILLNFIGLLRLRNPRHRETVRDFHERATKMVMDVAHATPERWAHQVKSAKADGYLKESDDADYTKMKEFFRAGNFRIEVPTEYHIQLEMRTFDEILPLIFKRNWALLKAPVGSGGFVTSDHPACLMWSEPKVRGRLHGPGLGLARTQITFPISTGLAVIGAFEIEEEEREVDECFVAAMNGTTMAFAERQVYARDLNFTYVMQVGEQPRKASRLIDDRRFLRPETQRPNVDEESQGDSDIA